MTDQSEEVVNDVIDDERTCLKNSPVGARCVDVVDQALDLIPADASVMMLVNKVGQDEHRNVFGDFGHLSDDVVKGPLFGHVKEEDDGMSALVNVHKLGVQGGVDGRCGFGGGQLEALQLDPFLALVHHVPHLDLDNVLCRFVIPLDVGHLDLLRALVGVDEGLALESLEQARLARRLVTPEQQLHVEVDTLNNEIQISTSSKRCG